MKYPKEIILKLKNNTEFNIKFERVIFLPTKDLFQAVIQISYDFVNSESNDVIEVITEEKEF
jgi:hypothetical protein